MSDGKLFARIHWPALAFNIFVYIAGLYGLFNIFNNQVKWQTLLWCKLAILSICARIYIYYFKTAFSIFMKGGAGVGPGAHRLFSHRSYKVTRPLKIWFIVSQTVAGQVSCHFQFK
jgi:stearoyl-CoA desaturase (delta-9 desaturase)